jgi:uncharacterized integral membrane protein
MSNQPPSPDQQPKVADKSSVSAGSIVSLVAFALLLVFMLQNTQDVRVRFLWGHATLPLWFIIFASALVGAIAWLGLGVFRRHRRRKARRQDRRD